VGTCGSPLTALEPGSTLHPGPMAAWKQFGLSGEDITATWHDVLINIQRGNATTLTPHNIQRAAEALLLTHQQFVLLIVVEPQAPPPAAQIRKRLSDFLASRRSNILRTFVVAEGGGFRAAIVRGVGVALSLLAPKALSFTFCDSVEQVAAALAPALEDYGGTDAFLGAIEEIRNDTVFRLESMRPPSLRG
jgi:hypothetical protein